MTIASDIFPHLPPRGLFYILIKIFQYLNEDKDIHTYRLVNRGWQAFIDNEILHSPAFRKQFLQHPLGLPAEQRRPLIRAPLCNDVRGGWCRDYNHEHIVCDRGQYVLISTTPTCLHASEEENIMVWIFRKTNVALQSLGSVIIQAPECLEQNALAVCQDSLFYLACRYPSKEYPSLMLHTFRKEGETWNTFQHPAKHPWEEEGVQLLGMRQISDTKLFLLVSLKTKGLIKVYNLLDGKLELSGAFIFSERLLATPDYETYGADWLSPYFDMDAFGLVTWTESKNIHHFSFASQRETWQTQLPFVPKAVVKSRKVTFLRDVYNREVVLLANETGVMTNRLDFKRLQPFAHYPIMTACGKYVILQGESLSHSHELVVFDIQESKMIPLLMEIPGLFSHYDNHFHVRSVMEHGDALNIAITFCLREGVRIRQCSRIVRVSSTHPLRMTMLPPTNLGEEIIATVPCDYGFFAIGHHVSDSNFQPLMFSLKY